MQHSRLVIVIVTCSVSACSAPKDMNAVAGTYVMHQHWTADTLWLKANGTYVRSYHAKNEPLVKDTGRWFLSRNHRLVALRDFPKRWAFVHDLMNDRKGVALLQPTTLALTVERTRLGKLRLGWHSTFGWWYDRIASGA
jgi:hypothetical protein